MRQPIRIDPLHLSAVLRQCWVSGTNKRLSCEQKVPPFDIKALIVESVRVDEGQQRKGNFKAFLGMLLLDDDCDMVIVETVQNPILAEALTRWGWECDSKVMDFYWVMPCKTAAATT